MYPGSGRGAYIPEVWYWVLYVILPRDIPPYSRVYPAVLHLTDRPVYSYSSAARGVTVPWALFLLPSWVGPPGLSCSVFPVIVRTVR